MVDFIWRENSTHYNQIKNKEFHCKIEKNVIPAYESRE